MQRDLAIGSLSRIRSFSLSFSLAIVSEMVNANQRMRLIHIHTTFIRWSRTKSNAIKPKDNTQNSKRSGKQKTTNYGSTEIKRNEGKKKGINVTETKKKCWNELKKKTVLFLESGEWREKETEREKEREIERARKDRTEQASRLCLPLNMCVGWDISLKNDWSIIKILC